MTLPDSTLADPKHAQNVCHACKLRKKACDKALPACGFCANRQLLCRYDISAPRNNHQRRHNPGKHFVPLNSPSLPNVSPQDKTATGQLPSPESQQDHTPHRHPSLYILPHPVEETLYQLAQYFTGLTKLTCDNIIDHYLQPSHEWLPIISPNSFRQAMSRCQEGRLPPADLMVLFLAMLTIILPALDLSSLPSHAIQESLYMTTKLAFAKVQASIYISPRLVQAALLIALREYTGIRPEASYVSLMTCVGLARVVGIGITTWTATTDAKKSNASQMEVSERDDLTWSIAMLERLILCEMDQKDLQPQTEYLCPNFQLSSDLNPAARHESKRPPLRTSGRTTLSNLDVAIAAKFKRQAQSISLLDQVLFFMRLNAKNEDTETTDLAKLDSEIRSFLEMSMDELDWRQTQSCVFVALCHRLLYLLHGSVLDTFRPPGGETDLQRREFSCIALDSVCRMTQQFAQLHDDDSSLTIPTCGFYNLRAARKLMQERNKSVVDETLSLEVDRILRAEERYRKTWGISIATGH